VSPTDNSSLPSEKPRSRAQATRISEGVFSAFDAVPDEICVIRDDQTVVFINRALRERVGDIVGSRCFETPLSSPGICRNCPMKLELDPAGPPHRQQVRSLEGSVREVVTTRVLEEGSETSYFISVIRDVTDAVDNEAIAEQLRSSFDSMQEGVAVVDPRGRVTYTNGKFDDIMGLRRQEAVGHAFADLSRVVSSKEPIDEILAEAFEEGWHGEFNVSDRGDKKVHVHCEIRPIKDDHHQTVGLIATVRDVTKERKEKDEFDRYKSQLEKRMEARTNELARRVSQLTTINKISRVVTSILDPDELMDEFSKSIATGLGYELVVIMSMDKDRGELVYKAGYGRKLSAVPRDFRTRLKEGIIGHAAYFSETLVSGDITSDPRYIRGAPEVMRSEVAVPITYHGDLVGVMDVQSSEVNAFTKSDVAMLEMLADILATAIANARTYTEAKEREQALSVLDKLSKQISMRLEPRVVMDQVVRDAASLLKAEKALIGRLVGMGDIVDWVATYNIDPELMNRVRSTPESGVTGRALKRLTAEIANDYASDPDSVERDADVLGIRSMVSAPLVIEGRSIGVVNVYNKMNGSGFTKADAVILSSLADHAAIAMENASLLSSLNQRVRTQLALMDTALSMQRLMDSGSIYETVADKLRDVVHYDSITIYRADHVNRLMVPVVARGSYSDETMKDTFGMDDSITGHVALTGLAEIVNNTAEDKRTVVIANTPEDEEEALMAVPMVGRDRVLGVLALYRSGSSVFMPEDLEVARLFANQASAAVENYELYKAEEKLLSETKLKVAQITKVLEISTSVMYMDDLGVVLKRVVDAVVESFGFRRASLGLLDEDGASFVVRAVSGFPDWVKTGMHVPVEDVLCGMDDRYKQSPTCYYVPFEKQEFGIERFHFLAHPERVDKPREAPDAWHERDIIVFSLRDRVGQLIGYLMVDEPDDMKVPSKDHLDVLEILSAMASIAVENSRLFEKQVFAVNEIALLNDLMTHDINNFNQGIMGYLELLLQDHRLSEGQKKYADKALVQVRNNARLIDNIRKLAKVRAMSESDFRILDLERPISESVEAVSHMFPDRNVSVMSMVEPGKHFVMANDYIRDLFTNIISNAVKFDSSTRIRVEISVSERRTSTGKSWIVSISDRGRGIPDDRKTTVFERFATGMTGIKGFGLGLSIVRTIVDKFDGSIWVEDRVKGDYTKGSVFMMSFPQAPAPAGGRTEDEPVKRLR
jgi:PAS domain S-box-containing protein